MGNLVNLAKKVLSILGGIGLTAILSLAFSQNTKAQALPYHNTILEEEECRDVEFHLVGEAPDTMYVMYDQTDLSHAYATNDVREAQDAKEKGKVLHAVPANQVGEIYEYQGSDYTWCPNCVVIKKKKN